MVTVLRGAGVLDTAAPHRDICSEMFCSGTNGQEAATRCPRGRLKPRRALKQEPRTAPASAALYGGNRWSKP